MEAKIIDLNVGGTKYSTSLTTLTRDPSSMLARMFLGSIPYQKDSRGRAFIDRDGTLFRYILNYLRDGITLTFRDNSEISASLAKELLAEARFFQLKELEAFLENIISNDQFLTIDCLTIKRALITTDESFRKQPDIQKGVGRLKKYLFSTFLEKIAETGSRFDISVVIDDFGFAPPLYNAAFDRNIRTIVMDDFESAGIPLVLTSDMNGPRRVFKFTLEKKNLLKLKSGLLPPPLTGEFELESIGATVIV
eukprot:TRINITY_DN624_c0_g1_i2.p1 TRINITY_DN624_c0_g1~~TRINITY_DN624_c0_g1_i2.p1  ORF type:complete len:251 (+),score=47.27 TRINITY_DN624_c0_g1_i2:664-1416(+)